MVCVCVRGGVPHFLLPCFLQAFSMSQPYLGTGLICVGLSDAGGISWSPEQGEVKILVTPICQYLPSRVVVSGDKKRWS